MIPYWSRRWGCMRGILRERWQKNYKSYHPTAQVQSATAIGEYGFLLGIGGGLRKAPSAY